VVTIAKHFVFSGSVQGVGFRFTALNIANRYKLTGYVRNMPRGDVEMVAQGEEETINGCVRDIEESFAGYIRDTQVAAAEVDPKLTDFRIKF
jgi:acylphosphatase